MSWFYEALKRVERDRGNAAIGDASSVTSSAGASLLATLESIALVPDCEARARDKAAAARSVIMAETEEARAHTTVVQSAASRTAVVASLLEREKDGFPEFAPFRLAMPENSRLVFHTDRHGLAAEQYRLLRRKIVEEFPQPAVLMLTSPGAGDGKTLTSLNLSACLADAEERTLLLELDLRRPAICATLACTPPRPGIEDILTGKCPPEAAIRVLDGFGIHLVTVADPPRDPSHLVNSASLRDLLDWAKKRFRWVVVDCSPVVPVADVADIAALADAMFLVVRAQRSARELTRKAMEMLGPRLHGVIFNEATVHSNPYYRYLTRYYTSPA